jgi:Na+(H+)/acetate symporter ActP
MADDDKDDDSKSVLIAAMALSIPILGILAVFGGMAYVPWVIITALVLVGGTFSARYLMDHRHRLRMEELAMQERLMREERAQLDVADRLLAADDEAVRRQVLEGDA